MTTSAVSLVLMAVLALGAAAKAGKGSCPDVPAMANFNATAMSGNWYDYAHTNRRTGLRLKCDLVKFTDDASNANQISFTSYSYSSATKSIVSVAGTAVSSTKRNSPEGKLSAKIPSLKIDGAEIKILSTDYLTFAVLYSCTEQDDDSYSEKSLILTREKNPNSKLKSATYKVLENNKISKKDLRATIHTRCHDYDLSSTSENQASTLGHGTSMGGLLSPPTLAQQATSSGKPTKKPSKN